MIGALVRDRAGASLAELEKTVRARAQELSQRVSVPPGAARRPEPSTLSRTLGIAVVVLLVLVLGMTVWRGPGEPEASTAPPASVVPEAPEPERAPDETTPELAQPTSADTHAPLPEPRVDEDEGVSPRPTTTEERASASERHATRVAPPDDAAVRAPVVASTPPAPAAELGSTDTPETHPRHDEGSGDLLGVEDFDRGTEHAP